MCRVFAAAMVLLSAYELNAETRTATVSGVDWQYTVEDGSAVLQGAIVADSFLERYEVEPVVTPSILGGYPVVKIADSTYGLTWDGISSLVISSNIRKIGSNAFEFRSAITSVVMQCGLEDVGAYAFLGTGIVSVRIPNTVTNVGSHAFAQCGSLSSVVFEGENCSLGGEVFRNGTSLTDVILPRNLTEIPYETFYYCPRLFTINIPDSVSYVGHGAFGYCSSLLTLTLPATLITIGGSAFHTSAIKTLVFRGNAPTISWGGLSQNLGISATVYVQDGSTGWGVTIPGTWQGLPIKYYEDEIVYSSIEYENTKGATHQNPTGYQEGTEFSFVSPSWVEGYTFTGWSPSGIQVSDTGNKMVLANWEANHYTIRYDANGGSGHMDDTDATYDQSVPLATNLYQNGFKTFTGWSLYKDDAMVYKDGQTVSNLSGLASGEVVLYASWSVVNVPEPIITPTDGSKFSGQSCTVEIACALEGATIYYRTDGQKPTLDEEFRYKGPFEISKTCDIVAFAVKDDLEDSGFVSAKITKERGIQSGDHCVTFIVPNGSTSVERYYYPTNTVYGVLPEARRDGYTFAGWYTSQDGSIRVSAFSEVNPSVTTLFARWVESNASLYAQWRANAYTIRFDANGGDGEMLKQDFLYDQISPLTANSFNRIGYTFKGWSVTPGGDVVYSDKENVSNLTTEAGCAIALFAKWEKVIDVSTETIEDWVGYDLAPAFKKAGETKSQYRKRFEDKFGDDYSVAFFRETGKVGADGTKLCVWHDYVAGTDPLDETSKFTASVSLETGVPVVTWNPALNGDGIKDGVRLYKVLGAKSLGGAWSEVNGNESDYKFFKVTVEIK